jgi:lysyl-tRNA synthetase class II
MKRSEALTQSRVEKLDQIKRLGIDPYPATSKRTHTTTEAKKSKDKKIYPWQEVSNKRNKGC